MNPDLENIQFDKVHRGILAKMIAMMYFGNDPTPDTINAIANSTDIRDLLQNNLPSSSEIKEDFIAMSKMKDEGDIAPYNIPIRCAIYMVQKRVEADVWGFIDLLNGYVNDLGLSCPQVQLPDVGNNLSLISNEFYTYMAIKKKDNSDENTYTYYLIMFYKKYWRLYCEFIFYSQFPENTNAEDKAIIIKAIFGCDDLCELYFRYNFMVNTFLKDSLKDYTYEKYITDHYIDSKYCTTILSIDDEIDAYINLGCMQLFRMLDIYDYSNFAKLEIEGQKIIDERKINEDNAKSTVDEFMNTKGGKNYLNSLRGKEY